MGIRVALTQRARHFRRAGKDSSSGNPFLQTRCRFHAKRLKHSRDPSLWAREQLRVTARRPFCKSFALNKGRVCAYQQTTCASEPGDNSTPVHH